MVEIWPVSNYIGRKWFADLSFKITALDQIQSLVSFKAVGPLDVISSVGLLIILFNSDIFNSSPSYLLIFSLNMDEIWLKSEVPPHI